MNNKPTIMLAVAMLFGLAAQAQTGSVYTMPYACGFDTTDLALLGWTTIDYNNDGYTWTTNGPLNGTPHSGSGYVASASYIYGTGDITPDNFLVSPRIALTGSAILKWWHRVAASGYPADHYSVYISTTGNTAADFLATTPLISITPTNLDYNTWNQQIIDLSAYAGDTIYIAFRHHNCFGQYGIMLDDVEVTPFVSPWSVADTVPWNTTFDTPDTGWTFIGRVNGWYIGAPGAMNGSGGMYVSGDGGATNSYERYSWNNRFHWAVRPLHFVDSGEYRIEYDWKCSGYYLDYVNTYYDFVRVFLAPTTVELDTALFMGNGINYISNGLVPAGWTSLSDTNGGHLLADASTWVHHAQHFTVPSAGDYLLLILSANGNSGSIYDVAPAMDNVSISALSCHNTVDTIRLTANSNQGLTVDWHDSQASQWAVYVNDSLHGTTTDTSYYLAGASWNAATCNVRPRIAVSPICSAGDTALPVNIVAKWDSNPGYISTVSCSPFTLPYNENFDTYVDNDDEFFGWYYFGGVAQYTENQQSHSGPMSLNMRAYNLPYNPSQIFVTPQFDAPGNRLIISFWAKLPAYSGAATDTIFQAGVLFDRDTMDYAHVTQNNTPMITLRGSDADGLWHQFLFSTEGLDTTLASITFSVLPNSTSYYECYIDDIEVTLLMEDSVPPVVAVTGPLFAIADVDTIRFSATLLNGDTTGLTYSWHSSLLNQSSAAGNQWALVYNVVGTDTITLIATNAFGSDTAIHFVTVGDNLNVSIRGASTAYVGDTMHYSVILAGDTTGLAYSWHSTLLDSTIVTSGPAVTMVYTATGTDTLTLTVVNVHGPHEATLIIAVQSCGIIASFPYSEDFENYGWQNRSACWLIRTPTGLIDNEWRRTNAGNNSSPYCMYSNGNSTGRGYRAWLISPAIELPYNGDSIIFSFAHRIQYIDHFAVLASPTGDPWYDSFTDTLFLATSTGYIINWSTDSLSLDAYRGRHIRLAFVHYSANGSMGGVRIDDLSIVLDTLPTPPAPPTPDTVWRTVTVACDSTMGTVSGGGEYVDSSLVTITAIPLEGYVFDRWNDGDTVNPRQVLVVSDTAFIALFQAIEDTVGIADIQNTKFEIQIYPNPASSDVTVEWPAASGPWSVEVIDLQGRTVIPPTQVNSAFHIPHSALQRGSYFIRCSNAHGTTVRKLTVVR